MRKDFQIAILLALAAIPAGVALMAAPEYIAVLKEYPAPFFWGGLVLASALIIAAIIMAIRGEASEPRSGHERRMIALTGMIVFGLGFIASAAVYFWPRSELHVKTAPQPQIEHSVFLQSAMGMMPTWMPAAGEINIIRLSPSELAKGGHNIVVERRGGQPGSEIKWPQSGRMPLRLGQRCEMTNYENSPLMEINIPLKITFRDSIKDQAATKEQASSHAGDIINSGEWVLEITKLDPGVNNSIVVYLINESPYFVDIPLPEVGTTYKWGETGRRTLRVVLPVNFLDRIPMVFQPYMEPVIAPPVATPPIPAPPSKPGKR